MLLLLAACASEPTLQTTWLAGDFHVHSSVASNDTDGLGLPGALGSAMQAVGLDFVYLTDHSNSAGSMHCDDVEDCPNLGPELATADWPEGVWLGSEISPVAGLDRPDEPTGHVGCLPRNGSDFGDLDHFVDRPVGTVTGGQALEQCLDEGGFAILNHPYNFPWTSYDWTSEAFEAVEVYNGTTRFDRGDERGLAAWEERVADGRALVPVGGSDCHRWGLTDPTSLFDPPLGYPTTWVAVTEGERPIDALIAGRVFIAEPGTTLVFTGERSGRYAGPGETLPRKATLRAMATTEHPWQVEIREVDGDALIAGPADGSTIEVEVGPGAYYARVWPEDGITRSLTPGIALTNVIRVE